MLLRVSAVFSPHLSLKYITYFFLSVCSLPDLSLFPAYCRVSSSCFPPPLPRRAAIRVPLSSLPSLRLSSAPPACCVSSGSCRHSSAIRRKTVWQCGQMHRVYVPGLASSCLCAAVCSVARPVACPACCRVSSGGNNRRYASISRAAAMRCSVWSVMLLLSMAIRKVWRCTPIRLDSSTTPTPAAFMCSLI